MSDQIQAVSGASGTGGSDSGQSVSDGGTSQSSGTSESGNRQSQAQSGTSETGTKQTESSSWIEDNETKEANKLERPDWLKPKFADVEAQAKNYTELEKVNGKLTQEQRELQARFTELEEKHTGLNKYFGSPEAFEFDPALYSKIDEAGKGVLEDFTNFARENNFSQDMYQNLIGFIGEWTGRGLKDSVQDVLSLENGAERLKSVKGWLNATFTKDELASIHGMGQTAANIQFFEKVRSNMAGESNIPAPGEAPNGRNGNDPVDAGKGRSHAEIFKEMASDKGQRFLKDSSYRQDVIERTQWQFENPGKKI